MRRAFLLALVLLFGPTPASAKDIVADLIVHRIEITSGFSGAELTLFGAIEGKGDVIAVVHGPSAPGGGLLGGTVDVRRKVRSFGIWVSGPYARFDNIPGFYAVAGSEPLEEIVTPDMRRRYQLGLDMMKTEAVQATTPDIADFAGALLRIRQRQGLYNDKVGHVSFVGDRLFRTSFAFPSSVPTGIYTVDVYLAREGRIVDAQSFPLLVNRAGFSADIYDFAHRHAAAYGAIAVVTALFFGWIAHLAFRRR
ncbi:MAG TPA: TIGR02186 family protein [Dongiaceae bacterium]|jgi:uncharacterized protein (TIGR02186 family)|nr:TIGR02186 family protein [Dongiaceae bacterium]